MSPGPKPTPGRLGAGFLASLVPGAFLGGRKSA